jgi:hypothetical protein
MPQNVLQQDSFHFLCDLECYVLVLYPCIAQLCSVCFSIGNRSPSDNMFMISLLTNLFGFTFGFLRIAAINVFFVVCFDTFSQHTCESHRNSILDFSDSMLELSDSILHFSDSILELSCSILEQRYHESQSG